MKTQMSTKISKPKQIQLIKIIISFMVIVLVIFALIVIQMLFK